MTYSKTGFNPAKYIATRWKKITADAATHDAVEEVAQKQQALAVDINLLPFMQPGCVMPWIGNACPPGWELVAELDGRVMIGTNEKALNAGVSDGSMTHHHGMPHTHPITAQAQGTSGNTNVDNHTHTSAAHDHVVTVSTATINTGNGTTGTANVVTGVNNPTGSTTPGATGTATTTDHNHTVPAHDHGAVTGASSAANTADSTLNLAHVKVLFCRRKMQ